MLLVSLFFIFSIMFVVPSYALNLENKILVSDDEDLIIEFGKNTVRHLLTETITTPNLEFGIIRLVDQDILLEGAFDDVSVKVLGDSIVITSFDVPVIIYARNVGDNNYSINLYTIDDGFKKQTFTATLETIESETVVQKELEIIEEVVTEPLINVLTAHYQNVDAGDPFVFVVKAFDINKYDGSDWANFYGKLDGVTIHAEILGFSNQILETVDGVTENGIFEGTVMLRENLWPEGWYTLSINAFYKGDTFNEDLKFFIQSKFVPSSNKAPIVDAGLGASVVLLRVGVILNGTASDPDGDPLTFLWTQTGGIDVILSDSSVLQPTFNAPDSASILTFQLTVSDNRAKSSSDTVTITVS